MTQRSKIVQHPPQLPPLISPPRRFRARGPRHAPLIPPPRAQPLLRRELELAFQLRARLLAVDEVAEAAADTALAAVEATARLPEVCDGRELAVDGASGVPARVELVAGGLGAVLVFEAGVDVADQV